MVTLRDASAEDAADIAAITQAWSILPGHFVTAPWEVSEEHFAADTQTIQKVGRIIVALTGDKVVGYAFLKPMDLEAIAHVFRLTIGVHVGYAGVGVGSAMLAELLSWAKENPKVLKIELLVRSTNRQALRLYEKYGFVEEGRLKERVRTREGKFIDDLSMALFCKRGV